MRERHMFVYLAEVTGLFKVETEPDLVILTTRLKLGYPAKGYLESSVYYLNEHIESVGAETLIKEAVSRVALAVGTETAKKLSEGEGHT